MMLKNQSIELVHNFAECVTGQSSLNSGNKMLLFVKAEFFYSAIFVLLCECVTRNTTFAEERKLAVIQLAMEQRMVGLIKLQYISNEAFRSYSGVKSSKW